MPIMTRMRDSMPVILFGLLIAFLITIVFEWGMDYLGIRGGQSDWVGKVNGKKVTYREFSELVKNLSDNTKSQTGQDPDEAASRELRDQAWQSIVTERLVAEEVARLGITVSDQELRDWVFGDNPPQELRRNFTDSTGNFNREMYEQVLGNPNQYIQDPRGQDPNYGMRKIQDLEKMLRQQRTQAKLQSLILASVRVTDGELMQRYADGSVRYEAAYALFDPGVLVKDNDVQVTDDDIRAYYQENIDQYKYEASRKLKYVLFPENPTAADTSGRQKDMEDALSKAKSGVDFLSLVYTYSDRPDSSVTFHRGELSAELDKAVFAASPGAVVGPVQDQDGLHLVKVIAEKQGANEYVHAAHILLPMGGPDSAAMKTLALGIMKDAKEGKDFGELARQYSKDGSNAGSGGDLGWFTKGRMVPAFEKAAFAGKTGEVVGPVRTPFGLHIIKILGRDNREVTIAHILMRITASSQSKNDIADRAKDFAYNARDNDFAKEAQQSGFDVHETQIQEKATVIPGVGINEAAVRWAFGAKVGAVSDPYTITNGSVVLCVSEAKNAGVRPFEELKDALRPLALRKKKMEKAKELAAQARASLAPGDSLAKLAFGTPPVQVQLTGQFTAGGSVNGVGRDLDFIGAVTGLNVGEISPPVLGTRGAYLIQLLSRTAFDSSAFAAQKEVLRSRMLQEKRSRFLSEWIAKLKEKADIEDRRDLFYR
ncbi:MAG TPA: peptidylprolyl isomerase [Bacteroidota bacterium]|nr:peptidylprolyl isomerase [Bacteroidota bacterium]